MKTLSVICPVHNEEEVIERFYETLAATCDGLAGRYDAEMIFVLDGCRDRTLEIMRAISARDRRVKVLVLSSNFGHQAALMAGIDHAHGDAVAMLDSDLQHPPALIATMLDELERGHDVVYSLRKETKKVGWFKKTTSRLFYRILNSLAAIKLEEGAADFRVISRRVARVFQHEIRERTLFLRGLFAWVGFKRIGVPFEVAQRGGGTSKYSFAMMLRFAVVGLVSFSKRPLYLSIIVGLMASLLGAVVSVHTLYDFFVFDTQPSGYTTLVILLSVFSGLQLIFLGIVGMYLATIFDEVKARPHYLVEEKVNFERASAVPGIDGGQRLSGS